MNKRYKDAKINDEIKDLVKKSFDEDKGIFLYGNTGVGKTYILNALANAKNVSVRNFTETLVEFRDAMQKGCYYEKIKDTIAEDYLFIDDIGSETLSNYVVEFLYIIVNGRYENMKRTVLATNLSINEFEDRYGDRILSRLGEMCVFKEMKGDDRRI